MSHHIISILLLLPWMTNFRNIRDIEVMEFERGSLIFSKGF